MKTVSDFYVVCAGWRCGPFQTREAAEHRARSIEAGREFGTCSDTHAVVEGTEAAKVASPHGYSVPGPWNWPSNNRLERPSGYPVP